MKIYKKMNKKGLSKGIGIVFCLILIISFSSFVSAVSCSQENGKFYLVDSDGSKEMVACCRNYCDNVYGEDYYCNYDVGCVDISNQIYKSEECVRGSDCGDNEICINFRCEIAGEIQESLRDIPNSSSTQSHNNNYTTPLIIAIAIIIGFIILAVVIKGRKKNE